MRKISPGRIFAQIFFLALLAGAVFCLQRLVEDISSGRYFTHPEQIRYEIVLLISYVLIIILVLRYGYFLAVNRVNWKVVKDDFLYILNRKYFSTRQWVFNVLLFWLALAGFIYALAVSAMRGNL